MRLAAVVAVVVSLVGCDDPPLGGVTGAPMVSEESIAAGQVPVGEGFDVFPVTTHNAEALPELLSVPQIVNGRLDGNDMRMPSSNGRCDNYILQLTAGEPVTVVARGGPTATPGSTLDMYIYLYANGTEVTHDDDSAGSLNSRIIYTPSATGTYVLRVSTFGGAENLGSYTLQTYAGALEGQP